MTTKTPEEIKKISWALDELMICKSRPVLSGEHKKTWLRRLVHHPTESVLWAIEREIETAGRWPEVAYILEGCGKWLGQNRERFDRELDERVKRDLIAPKEARHAIA
jgi:hypothetical protein